MVLKTGVEIMTNMTFMRALRSEGLRLRRSPLVPLHLILAVILGGCAGAYFSYSAWDSMLGTDAFFQLLGAGVPLLVGISCGLALDVEHEAGDYANLLGVASRRKALAAKGVALLLLLLFAALVAALLFCGILVASGRAVPSVAAVAAAVAGIVVGSVGLYVISLFVALRFGRNASIGVGALGLVVAMASMGGLANGLVTGTLSGSVGAGIAAFIPFTWPSRFASLSIELAIVETIPESGQITEMLISTFAQIGITCAVITIALAVLALVAANRFENKRHAA